MKVSGLSHVTIGVKNLEISKQFYSSLFGVEPLYEEAGRDCHFVMGELWFILVCDDCFQPAKGYSHIAFKVGHSDFDGFKKRIRHLQAKIWQINKTFGNSIYFEDPDGHQLEIHASTWQARFAQLKS